MKNIRSLSATGLAALTLTLAPGAVFAQTDTSSQTVQFGHYLKQSPADEQEAVQRQAGQTGLPLWTHTYTFKGKSYSYEMVGTDPALGSQTTTVPTYIVPIKLTFSDGTVLDPAGPEQVLPVSALQAFAESPFFQVLDFKAGSVDLGTTQYMDAFQRANFWDLVSTVSPDYHMLLAQPLILPELAITLNASQGQIHTLPNGVKWAIVNSNILNGAAIKYLGKSKRIKPSGFAIFLTYNAQIGGGVAFHSSLGAQTFTLTVFNDPGVLDNIGFPTVANIEVSTHEVGEWMDDPFGNNIEPAGILEVGDPLDGSHSLVQLNGLTYNLQELAFHDYFTCAKPSTSVNGWYSYLGTFLTPSPGCP